MTGVERPLDTRSGAGIFQNIIGQYWGANGAMACVLMQAPCQWYRKLPGDLPIGKSCSGATLTDM